MRKTSCFDRILETAIFVLAIVPASRASTFTARASPDDSRLQNLTWLAPSSLAATRDGKVVFAACTKGRCVEFVDAETGRTMRRVGLPGELSGLVLSADERRLYATCAGAQSRVCEIDARTGVASAEWKTGHTALSPTLSSDGKTLYVCLRFDGQIAVFDLQGRRETARIQVGREPVCAAATLDGRFLFVAHHLPSGRADASSAVAATVGIVNLSQARMQKELRLPNGSSLLRELRLSPDGRYAAVVHNLGHYQVPTTQLERGWMNTAALTVLATDTQEIVDTVLLDEVDRGAANPWAVAWSPDGQRLLITHAGTHELSVVDFPALIAKLTQRRLSKEADSQTADDLAFLVGLRERVPLRGNGPRACVTAERIVYVADYFSELSCYKPRQWNPCGAKASGFSMMPRSVSRVGKVARRVIRRTRGWMD